MRDLVLMYCYVRYGAGHWMRTLALGQALRDHADVNVVVAASGRVPPALEAPAGFTMAPMPEPVGEFSGRAVGDGPTLGPALLDAIERLAPAAIVLESFPFGRQDLAVDMARCLAALRRRERPPLVVSSVRDIQQRALPRQDWLDRMAVDFANRYCDAVLAHTDPALIPFAATFPRAGDLRVPVHETGYVVPPEADPRTTRGRTPAAARPAGRSGLGRWRTRGCATAVRRDRRLPDDRPRPKLVDARGCRRAHGRGRLERTAGGGWRDAGPGTRAMGPQPPG
ncbi:MAG: hypothetical protein R2712_28425 [Vicinamibacterales bacterium]